MGFWILRSPVEMRDGVRADYFGIDRLPYMASDDRTNAWREEGRVALADAWDAYAAEYYRANVHVDRGNLESLAKVLTGAGEPVEVGYAELTAVPQDLGKYKRGVEWAENLNRALGPDGYSYPTVQRRPDRIVRRGFDITHPVPSFHSAILQPGVARTEELGRSLNVYGLVEEFDVAVRLCDAANEADYGALPFCVVEVWTAWAPLWSEGAIILA